MLTLLDLLMNLFPPVIITISGYALYVCLFKSHEQRHALVEKWLVSLIFGITAVELPPLFLCILVNRYLNVFYFSLTIFLILFDCWIFISQRRRIKNDMSQALSVVKNLLRGDLLERAFLISFIVFFIKTILMLSLRPLNDADALAYYLPTSKYFKEQDGVGLFTDAPAVSLLYSWTEIFLRSTDPFRLLPSVFVLSYPILIYALSKTCLDRRYAMVATALSCFSPFIDSILYFYALYPDIYSATFVVAIALFLFKKIKTPEAPHYDFYIGLSLCLSFLFKPAYGIVALIFLISFCLAVLKLKVAILAFATFLSTILGFVCFWRLAYGLTESFYILISLGSILIMILATVFVKIWRNPIKSRTINRWSLLKIAICLIPLVSWVTRQVYMGGEPLGIPVLSFFSPSTSNPDFAWLGEFSRLIAPQPEMLINCSYIFILFYHPLTDIYLTPYKVVGLVNSSINNRYKMVGFLLILSYFLFFMMGTVLTVRHLLIASCFLYPVVSMSISGLTSRRESLYAGLLTCFVLMYGILATFQGPTFSLWIEESTSPAIAVTDKYLLQYVRVNTPWAEYEDVHLIKNAFVYFAIAVGLFVLTMLILKLLSKMKIRAVYIKVHKSRICLTHSSPRRTYYSAAILFLCCSTIMLVPFGQFAENKSAGNLLEFETTGSYYSQEIHIANYLNSIVNGNDVVLTFFFNAFYFLDFKYIDLLHGLHISRPLVSVAQVSTIRKAVEAPDTFSLEKALQELKVRYLLVPNPIAHGHTYFEKFQKISKMLTILTASGCLRKVAEYDLFQLYEVTYNWRFQDGILLQTNAVNKSSFGDNFFILPLVASNFNASICAKVIEETSGHTRLGLIFGAQNFDLGNRTFYMFAIFDDWNSTALIKFTKGHSDILAQKPYVIPEKLANITVRVSGKRIMCYVDDVLHFDLTDQSLTAGAVAFFTGEDRTIFTDATVTSSTHNITWDLKQYGQ